MVYGEEALGYKLPEDYPKKPFLINKVEEILGIPDSPSPGAYVKKQKPYKVLFLVISIRTELKAVITALRKSLEEGEKAKKLKRSREEEELKEGEA